MILFRDIFKQRDSLNLKKINLMMEPGYIHLINGKNSHGKSTLLKLLAGIIQPDEGVISVNGMSVDEFKSKRVVSYMPDLLPLENIGTIEGLMDHMNGFKNFSTVDFKYYLNKFGIALQQDIKEISLGEKKIVHFCLALSKIADMYLLDEPSLHMDRDHLNTMQTILQEIITDATKYVLIATNNVADFMNYADYFIYMKQGSIILNIDRETLMTKVRLIDKTTFEMKRFPMNLLWKDDVKGKYLVESDDETLGTKVNGIVEILKIIGDFYG